MALFESYERRIDQINAVLNSYGIASIEEAEKITKDAGLDVYAQIKGIQPICFENACWLTPLVQQSQSRRAAVRLLTLQLLSVRVFSPSVSRDLLQIPVR